MLAAIHPNGYRQAAIALHHTDFFDLLPTINVPTLVIAGEHDQVVAMEHSRQLAEGIPGARFDVIAGSGHLSNQQKPNEYNAIVRAFLRAVEG
jgi:pimeloyl-ACP methyl ester carboxylesterase